MLEQYTDALDIRNFNSDEAVLTGLVVIAAAVSMQGISATIDIFTNASLDTVAFDIFGGGITYALILGVAALGYTMVTSRFGYEAFVDDLSPAEQAMFVGGVAVMVGIPYFPGLESWFTAADWRKIVGIVLQTIPYLIVSTYRDPEDMN
jgi:hypothetical protein